MMIRMWIRSFRLDGRSRSLAVPCDGIFEHPVKGRTTVQLTRGCPEISREDALGLIKDLEDCADPANLVAVQAKESTSEVMWLERLLEDHPVFEGMPQHLKQKMLDTPAKDLSALGINKRVRKRIKNGGGGAVVHLYAGPDRGFTLKRAMKEAGGDTTVLLEYDTKRDPSHDMLRPGGLYAGLLRLAMDGQMDAILGGPNCRTRSVLLHAPRIGYPGPSRSRGHPWGLPNLFLEARRKVTNDDMLLFRMVLLFIVAQMARDSQIRNDLMMKKELGKKKQVGLLLEQPAEPQEEPNCASLWRMFEWTQMQRFLHLQALTFYRGTSEDRRGSRRPALPTC